MTTPIRRLLSVCVRVVLSQDGRQVRTDLIADMAALANALPAQSAPALALLKAAADVTEKRGLNEETGAVLNLACTLARRELTEQDGKSPSARSVLWYERDRYG